MSSFGAQAFLYNSLCFHGNIILAGQGTQIIYLVMLCAFGLVVDAMHMINSAKCKESQTQATAQPERSL